MKCLIKIHHRHLIYSFLFVAFLSFLSVFGFASDSYATSGTCTVTLTDYIPNSSSTFSYYSSCNSTDPLYYSLDSFNFTISNSGSINTSVTRLLFNFYNQSPSYYANNFYRDNSSHSLSVNDSYTTSSSVNFVWASFQITDGVGTPLSSPILQVILTSQRQSDLRINGTITLSYATDLADLVGDSEPCPEVTPCPPIPENPYDQKLDDIKRAILTVGAILIMIYFFICLYKIVVKDGGSRK